MRTKKVIDPKVAEARKIAKAKRQAHLLEIRNSTGMDKVELIAKDLVNLATYQEGTKAQMRYAIQLAAQFGAMLLANK